jgi:hypothetical protein
VRTLPNGETAALKEPKAEGPDVEVVVEVASGDLALPKPELTPVKRAAKAEGDGAAVVVVGRPPEAGVGGGAAVGAGVSGTDGGAAASGEAARGVEAGSGASESARTEPTNEFCRLVGGAEPVSARTELAGEGGSRAAPPVAWARAERFGLDSGRTLPREARAAGPPNEGFEEPGTEAKGEADLEKEAKLCAR